jgi:putative ABC transport system ATP-binding protein
MAPDLLAAVPQTVPILEVEGLVQRLRDTARPEAFTVRVEPRIEVMPGDFVALLGPSGCGKTTLLTVLGLLRSPTYPSELKSFKMGLDDDGTISQVDLRDAWLCRRKSTIEAVRRQRIGFALQSGELLPALTVRENIEAPLHLNGWPAAHRRKRADHLIEAFRLRRQVSGSGNGGANSSRDTYDLATARVNKLSGGEYQRVSLARAIAHHPQLVFIDEPTAALNRELARGALGNFRQMLTSVERRCAAIMITHDEELSAEFANVVIRMEPTRTEAGGCVNEVVRRHSR